jgi:pimeloyl-ACP methyl ester carboxylesterase
MRQDIEFAGFGGTTLRGWLYLPDGPSPGPAVVMAHGLSAVKEMALDDFAEAFCAAGLRVLCYDHRNLGASDGEPRQQINPWAQARDYRYALSWLALRPEVDAERIGLWGSSYSGAHAIIVGACDRRVRAVAANVPLAGYPEIDYSNTAPRFEEMRAVLLDESGKGLADAEGIMIGPVPVVREAGVESPMVILDQPESSQWFLDTGRSPGSSWRNEVTIHNGFGTQPTFDPGVCVAALSPTPLLFVVADQDRVSWTEVTLEAFERAGEPKRLELLHGHHFSPYSGEALAKAASAARDFFLEHL